MAESGTTVLRNGGDSDFDTLTSQQKYGSVRSTKSLSVFLNQDAPMTLRRSEEVTIDMYANGPDLPSKVTKTNRKRNGEQQSVEQKTTRDNKSSKQQKLKNVSTNNVTEQERQDYILQSPVDKKGSFQMKSGTSPNAVAKMESPSLHDAEFRSNLEASLNMQSKVRQSDNRQMTTEIASTETVSKQRDGELLKSDVMLSRDMSLNEQAAGTALGAVTRTSVIDTMQDSSLTSPTDSHYHHQQQHVNENVNSRTVTELKTASTAAITTDNSHTSRMITVIRNDDDNNQNDDDNNNQVSASSTAEIGSVMNTQEVGNPSWYSSKTAIDRVSKTALILDSSQEQQLRSPPDIDTSTNSAIRNKAIKAKFESMLSRSEDVQSSPGSSVRSPTKTYLRKSGSTTATEDRSAYRQNSLSSVGDGDGEKLITSSTVNRMEEVQSLIREGTVSRLSRQLSNGIPSYNSSPARERRQLGDTESLTDEATQRQFTEHSHLTTGGVSISHDELELNNTTSPKDAERMSSQQSQLQNNLATHTLMQSEDEQLLKEARFMLRQRRNDDKQTALQHLSDDDSDAWPTSERRNQHQLHRIQRSSPELSDIDASRHDSSKQQKRSQHTSDLLTMKSSALVQPEPDEYSKRFDGATTTSSAYELRTETVGNHDTDVVADKNVTRRNETTVEKQQQQEQKYSETMMTLAAESRRQTKGDDLTSHVARSSPQQLSKQPLITTQRDETIDISWAAPDSGTDEPDAPTPDLETMVDQPINLEWTASQSNQSVGNTSRRDHDNTSYKQEEEYLRQRNVIAAEKRGQSGSRSEIARDQVDGTASRPHMKPRDIHYPQRVHSIASSDITPSIESLSSNDPSSPVDTLRRPVRQYSQSSSDATLTDNERSPPYRGRRVQTTGREHMKRVTQPPDDRPLTLSTSHLTDNTMKIVTDEQRLTPVRLYAGRGPTPVSGRQKIRRSTGSTGDDWEMPTISQYTKSGKTTNQRSITPTYTSYTAMPLDDEIRASSFDDRPVSAPRQNLVDNYPRSRQAGSVEIKVVNSGEAEPIYRDRMITLSGREKIRRNADLPLRTETVPPNHRRHLHHSMPDLQDPEDNWENDIEEVRKHTFVDRKPLSHNSVNYSSDYGKNSDYRPVHSSHSRRRRTLELPGQLTTSVMDLPTQTNDRYNKEQEQQHQPTQQQQQQQPVVRIINHPAAQLNRISRSGSTADVIGRKRGYIMRATVENAGYPAGRKHWRRDNMAATDIEDMDLDDDTGRRRLTRRHRSFVAKVRVGDDECDFESDDALSVFSEPAFVLHHSRTVSAPPRQLNSSLSTPLVEYIPRYAPAPAATYSLAHVDTRINSIMSPVASQTETIESVDPELKDASKRGTNYHITLTLKPVINSRPASRAQMTEINRTMSDATQFRIQTPVTQTPSLSTSRIETSGYTQQPAPSVHLRATSRSGSRADVLRTQSRIDTSSNEIVIEPINRNVGASGHSPRPPKSQRQSLGQIAFDVEVHSDDELVDDIQLTSSIHTVDAPQYKLPLSSSLEIKYDPNESVRQTANNRIDGSFKQRVNEVYGKEEPIPTVKRRSFLISNAIDKTKDAKISDVARAQSDDDDDHDDHDDSDDDIDHNTNMFDSLYFQTKENPLYSSDQELQGDLENDEDEITVRNHNERQTQSVDQHDGSVHSRVASVQTQCARHVDQGNQTDRPRTKETAVQQNASLPDSTQSTRRMNIEKRRDLDETDTDVVDGAFNNTAKPRTNRQLEAPKRDTERDEAVRGSHFQNAQYNSKPYESYSPPSNDSHDELLTKRSLQLTEQSSAGLRPYQTSRDDGDISVNKRSLSTNQYVSNSGEHGLLNYDRTEDHDIASNEANYFQSTSNSNRLPQAALQVQEMFEDGDFDQEVAVSREFGKKSRVSGMHWDREQTANSRQSARASVLSVSETIARLDVHSLMVNAPTTSVRQTIDVERLEDEILMGPQPNKQAQKSDLSDAGIADYDTVSEQVGMEVVDNGLAVMTARVRCERTVPIRGSADMFKKSSVIVTKCIEVDLTVTPQRLNLLKTIKGVSTSQTEDAGVASGPLNQSDVLVLYKKFITLAEMNKANRISK